MKKSELIMQLLKENKNVLLNGDVQNGICFDGIVDEDIYDKQKVKVAVLLKETNGNDFDGNETLSQTDFDYVHWLKHQQVNNEPEKRIKNNKEYMETKVFYQSTFKKLCHWLSMFFDIASNGDTSPEKFLKDGKVDIPKVRKILNNVAVINLKKTWGKEKTNTNKLYEYSMKKEISDIFKRQLEIINPDVVLCCSPDVFWIAKEIYDVHSKNVIEQENKKMFVAGNVKFVKLIHPQWYGKKESILAKEMKEIFCWVLNG